MRRRWISWVMTSVLCAAITACGGSDGNRAAGDGEVQGQDPTAVDVPEGNDVIVETQATEFGQALPTAGPLGGVTIDDPLPPQVDAVTDPAAAEIAVRYAYQHYILVDLDKDLRAILIEGGEGNVEGIAAGFEAARPIAEFARIEVDSVAFTSATTADLVFRMRWQDGPSPYFPDPQPGTAIFQNGTWRISGRSLCVLSFGAGQDCAAPDAQLPTVPEQLVFNVPDDFGLVADGQGNVFDIPGGGSWSTANGASISINADVLTGVTEMTAQEQETILASGRFGVHDGTPMFIGNAQGRVLSTDDMVQLAMIRPDGVMIQVIASGLALPTVIELVQLIQPAGFPEPDPNLIPSTTLG
jgi:hypothetical protein